MSENTYKCPHCSEVNERSALKCTKCEQNTTIATLKSLGTGSAPKDFVWPLIPAEELTLGSATRCDIVVPSNRLSPHHCTLTYEDGAYFINTINNQRPAYIGVQQVLEGMPKKLENGMVVKIGLDQLRITYQNLSTSEQNLMTDKQKASAKEERNHSMNPIAARMMLIMGYLQELHASLDLKELMSNSVDAILKLTGLDRGYAFVVEYNEAGEMNLNEFISRKTGGEDFVEKDYTISKSMLTKVLQSNGAVIIDDADQAELSTHSMRDFKIKTLVCVPIMKFDKETQKSKLLGIIYCDKLLATTKLPAHTQSTLQLLSQLITENFERCQVYADSLHTLSHIGEFINHVAEELDVVSDNFQVISSKLHEDYSEGHDENLKIYLQHIVDQSGKLHEITTTLKESIE